MFEKFRAAFQVDDHARASAVTRQLGDGAISKDQMLQSFLLEFGGLSFNGGQYRVLSLEMLRKIDKLASEAFPNHSARINCFAIDWLGRAFALDSKRTVDGHSGILMLEPGTGEVLEIPCNLVTFHESELIDFADEALAKNFHADWLRFGGKAPNSDQCVGYKKPLFLGGSDTVSNLEIADIEVYWSICADLLRQVRGMPLGTKLSGISIG